MARANAAAGGAAAPAFWQTLSARYADGVAHAFVLHGNVQDYAPGGGGWTRLEAFLLARLTRFDLCAALDAAHGLRFPLPGHAELATRALGVSGASPAAQILALPLILYAFGNLSLIAPIANVVMLPMVPSAMLFGALALVGGMIWLPLGQLLALPAYLFLAWLTEGARLFGQLPWAAVQLPPFPLWLLLAYYTIVVGAWLWNATAEDVSRPPLSVLPERTERGGADSPA